jgi:uncharacterized protein
VMLKMTVLLLAIGLVLLGGAVRSQQRQLSALREAVDAHTAAIEAHTTSIANLSTVQSRMAKMATDAARVNLESTRNLVAVDRILSERISMREMKR